MPITATRMSAANAPVTTGTAMLAVNATTIDVIGNSSLQGFGRASLAATEDIRLVGMTKVDLSQTTSTTPENRAPTCTPPAS